MQAKVALLVVILGLCACLAAADWIHDVHRAKVVRGEETAHKVVGPLKPVEVARALARTQNSSGHMGGVDYTYEQLLQLNSYDLAADCSKDELARRNEVCSHLGGTLENYCRSCVAGLEQLCKEPAGRSVWNITNGSILREAALAYRNYSQSEGINSAYPMKLAVEDFLLSRAFKISFGEFASQCLLARVELEKLNSKFASSLMPEEVRGKFSDDELMDLALDMCQTISW